ncbi:MAG: acetolactate synthase 3 regulatory subunit [Sporolactobacillus sp.]|jgi:acetolactate synthase small subunit|nr:acetolactate synthase 3 regulatory subunit [Sporolactobacillus sp.]MCI1880824.1 acetolactate synthase 3 regulatory subunit [Sporolactobacillus sp.]
MKRTIIAIANNNPDVLGRVANLISRSQLPVDALTMQKLAGGKGQADISILLDVNQQNMPRLARLVSQMDRLIDILSVADMT